MKMYRTIHHPEGLGTAPEFEIRGRLLFAAQRGLSGSSPIPCFHIKNKRLYPTPHHPEGRSSFHWFEIRENKTLIPSVHHPNGGDCHPWYKIK